MSQINLLRSLRAVRRFSDREIPAKALDDILEVAQWTGSSKNTQPWELVVVGDRSTLGRLSRLGRYADHVAGARLAIALTMERATLSTEFDKGRLAQNIMLAAWAYRIGSCIASLFPEKNERAAKELLGVPAERELRTVISLGYPADEEALRLTGPLRRIVPTGRKPLDQLVSWERYGERHKP
jgi:nitroreductase